MGSDEGDRLKWIAQICQTPEDDNIRRFFADWLREHGEWDRGEFIDVQCEMAEAGEGPYRHCAGYARERKRCSVCVDCQEAEALRSRQGELWSKRAYGEKPSGFIASLTFDYFGRMDDHRIALYSRGFVASVTCTAEDWLRHGDELTWGWAECKKCKAFGPGHCKVARDPVCDGSGRVPRTMWCSCVGRSGLVYDEGGTKSRLCKRCQGSGSVPRPCPPTAQPITEVRLTTSPIDWLGCKPVAYGESITCDRWPGVTFHLPQTETESPDPVRGSLADSLRGAA